MSWHIDGRPLDETYATEGEAVAAAWALTPPGEARPEVRLAARSGMTPQDLAKIFSVPDEFTAVPPDHKTRRVPVELGSIEMGVIRGEEVIETTLRASVQDLRRAGFAVREDAERWMRERVLEEVIVRVKVPVALVGSDFRIERRPEAERLTMSSGILERIGPVSEDVVMSAVLRRL